MALETLKGIEEIDGFKVIRDKPEDMSWDDFDKMRLEYPINITDRMNCISFKIQDGPVKENGLNGCQLTTLIATAKIMLEKLNEKFPCVENDGTIAALDSALHYQKARTKDREARGVEGKNNV